MQHYLKIILLGVYKPILIQRRNLGVSVVPPTLTKLEVGIELPADP